MNYEKPVSKSTLKRRRKKNRLLTEQQCRCCYCAEPITVDSGTFDHVTARADGGGDGVENMVLACYDCNQAFADAPPKEKILMLYRRLLAALNGEPQPVKRVQLQGAKKRQQTDTNHQAAYA